MATVSTERRRSSAALVSAIMVALAGSAAAEPAVAADTTRAAERRGINAVPVEHQTVIGVDAGTGALRAVVPVGPYPLLLCVASGHVWTLNFGDGTLTQVDPEAETSRTIDPGEVVGVACHGGDLWIARDGNVLARLDGATGQEEAALQLGGRPLFAPHEAGFVGVADGSLWLTVPPPDARFSAELWRIDPHSGDVIATIPTSGDANPPFADGRYLWVVTKRDQGLTRVDVATNESVAVAVDRFPWAVVAGAGSMWIIHQVIPKLRRFDPDTFEVSAELPLETNPRGLTFGGGRLWVATENAIVAVDPTTNQATTTIELGPFPPDTGLTGIAYLDGVIWTSIE